MSPARVWAALAVVYVVWGSTYLGILLAIDTIPVFLSMGIRFVIAGGLLYVWAVRRGDVTGDRPGRRQWAAALVVGALLFVGGNSLVAWSETRVDTGIAALLIAAVPLWMALFDRVANGQGLSRSTLLGLLVGFGGVALLAWPSGPSRIDALGAAALLVSGAAWAAGSLVARRASLPQRPLVSSGMQMFAGGMLLMLVAGASGELTEVGHVSMTSVAGDGLSHRHRLLACFLGLRLAAPGGADERRLDVRLRQSRRGRLPRLGRAERADFGAHARRRRRSSSAPWR